MVAKLIALVIPLGLDTFAVCAALGLSGIALRRRVHVSLLMATFEAGMPLVGLAIGHPLGHLIGSVADYLAVAVLLAFGLHLLLTGDDEEERVARFAAFTSVRTAIALGLSISLDELAIGFTLGLLRLPVLPVIVAIALQALVVSQLGMGLGARLGDRVREGAERIAGAALAGLAVALLVQRIL